MSRREVMNALFSVLLLASPSLAGENVAIQPVDEDAARTWSRWHGPSGQGLV